MLRGAQGLRALFFQRTQVQYTYTHVKKKNMYCFKEQDTKHFTFPKKTPESEQVGMYTREKLEGGHTRR